MPKAFCPECGQPNQYSDVKPKYCGFCTAPLDITTASVTPARPQRPALRKKPSLASRYRREEEEEDDFDGPVDLPDIKQLDIEISLPEVMPREKVGDVWGSNPKAEIIERPHNKKPLSQNKKKQALADFTNRIFKKTILDSDTRE